MTDSRAADVRQAVTNALTVPLILVHTKRHHRDNCGREMWDDNDEIIRTRLLILDRIADTDRPIAGHRDDTSEWYDRKNWRSVPWVAGCCDVTDSPLVLWSQVEAHFAAAHGVTLVHRGERAA